MSPVVGTHLSLELQGLGSRCFPVPMAGSSIAWLGKEFRDLCPW